jgi:hypothetical protein
MIRWIRLLILLFGTILYSCAEEAEVPAFLKIGEPVVKVTSGQGTAYQKISENYFFLNTDLLGGYSVGSEFPVLAEGIQEFIVFAGVRNNGIAAQPSIYSPLMADTISIDLQAGEIHEVNPTFQYTDRVRFRLVDNFENSTLFSSDQDGDESTSISVLSGAGWGGSGAGYVQVTPTHPLMEATNTVPFTDLPRGSDIYLEVTYKCDVQLVVGLLAKSSTLGQLKHYKVVLNPKEDWNKVYINFEEDILQLGFDQYQILLSVLYDPGLVSDKGEVYLDDIKLLHF